MKQTLILSVVALALFSGLGVAQTSSSQKSVIINHGNQVEVQLTDANGTVTTHTGSTTADAIAKSQSKVSQVKDNAMPNDRHPMQSAAQTTQTKGSLVKKNQDEQDRNVTPVPIMVPSAKQETSAPKN